MSGSEETPQLYLSVPHPCSYLPDRTATTLFIDPRHPIKAGLYGALMAQGFRRSGDLIYRPHCKNCSACVPVRTPTGTFRPGRGQRRVWRKNVDLQVRDCEPVFQDEHFELYRRYQAKRHPGGGMDNPDPDKYMEFLTSRHAHTRFFEFRECRPPTAAAPGTPGRLLCVAVADLLSDGLSAVYTFFEPGAGSRGLGVNAILWEIEYAKARGLPRLYLGYWIKQHRKMSYKTGFRPLEAYLEGRWTPLGAEK